MSENNLPALLDIYSASAGSGKTYTLAMQFIDLLINNPRDYEHILAVTFTKKATAEMKERILENLFLLANKPTNPDEEKRRNALMMAQLQLAQKNGHTNEKGQNITEADIAERCGKALLFFLNDFSQFNISTIDSFVQRVIRAFAYEANLPAQYGITLEKELLIDEAIEDMMLELKSNSQLENWLMTFAKNNIDNGKRWSVEKSIRELCIKFFDQPEANNRSGSATPEMDEIKKFVAVLNNVEAEGEKNIIVSMKELKNEFLAIGNLVDEFNGNNSFVRYLRGDATDQELFEMAKKLSEGINKQPMFKKDHSTYDANKTLVDSLLSRVPSPSNCNRDFYTAHEVLKNIYVVGVWGTIKRHIDEISRRNGELPISETNVLLSKLINGTEVPFIYEKVGSRFKNIMIDEFQDTSRVQWNNFRPLVKNCVDTNEKALIVGDVKQAIYRWRQSDWQLLAQQVEKDIQQTARTSLDTNWRSEAQVIRFNNALFATLGRVLSQKISEIVQADETELCDIYSQCEQQIPAAKKERNAGFVRLQFDSVDSKQKKQSSEEDYVEDDDYVNADEANLRCEQLADTIIDLHNRGYSYQDICILVRRKKDGESIMRGLSAMKLPIISPDSLIVNNSPVVRAIVSHMRYIDNHNNEFTLAHALDWEELSEHSSLSDKLLNKKELSEEILKLRGLGLIELTEAIIRLLPQQEVENQHIFVEAFQNCVFQFASKRHANLHDFLDYYDETADNIKVEAPDSQDAIQLMTIHKSKGLQFRVVLIPFANWDISGKKQNYIWAKLPAPFDVISPMPLLFSSKLMLTHASDIFRDELRMCLIDSINLLYVAFTRAEEMLYVWANRRSKDDEKKENEKIKLHTIDKYLIQSVLELVDGEDFADFQHETIEENNSTSDIYVLGQEPKTVQAKSKTEQDILHIKPYETNSWSQSGRICIHNESEADGFAQRHNIIAYGNTMHHIMERISTVADVEKALKYAMLTGEIDSVQCETLNTELRQKLSDDAVLEWFDGSMKRTQTEVEFVTLNHEYRPDRIMLRGDGTVVVVDYKFGAHKSNKYLAQVRQYMQLIKGVGYQRVEGYIWYFETNEVVAVGVA